MRSITNNTDTFRHRILTPKILSVFSTLIFIVLFFVLSPVNLACANETSPVAPTLISIAEGAKFVSPQPTITGLTFNNTQVDIFIDNRFNGQAIVRNHESGVANFYYHTPLLSAGKHVIYAIARKGDDISQETPKISFQILGTAAPTLFTPVFNLQTIEFRPFIVGLVHNNSRVKIYIDGQYDGEIWVKNHPSGVANFAYKPKHDLIVGMHQVRAVTINRITGQESGMSSMVSFEIKQPYPAPTLFRPTVKGATWFKPNINGLAKNGSHVEVYVNDIKHRINFQDDPSGSTSFTYRPEQNLRAGMNVVFTVAYSKTGKMSRKSNIIYWDLTPIETGEAEPSIPISDTTIEEPDIEIDFEDRSSEAQVTITEEDVTGSSDVSPDEPSVVSSVEPVVSGEADVSGDIDEISKDTETGEEDELEDSANWSKIIGLIILAVLIITLIIQLLKKEEPEDKQGETLSLFEDGEKKKEDTKKEKPKTDKVEKADKDKKSDDIIPPPPPPSSNLPF